MDVTTKVPWAEINSEPFVDAGMEMPSEPAIETMEYDCVDLLRRAGLRPTRQRVMLGVFLFAKGGRHVTAEKLHAEAVEANLPISMVDVIVHLRRKQV